MSETLVKQGWSATPPQVSGYFWVRRAGDDSTLRIVKTHADDYLVSVQEIGYGELSSTEGWQGYEWQPVEPPVEERSE